MHAIWLMHVWPDAVDMLAVLAYLTVALSVPALGYLFMVVDFRAYLRSLRRYLVRLSGENRAALPAWAEQETPRCIAVFGLQLPCSEAELKRAYRNQVKRLHPDLGGDRQRFLLLQTYFEESLDLLSRGGNA